MEHSSKARAWQAHAKLASLVAAQHAHGRVLGLNLSGPSGTAEARAAAWHEVPRWWEVPANRWWEVPSSDEDDCDELPVLAAPSPPLATVPSDPVLRSARRLTSNVVAEAEMAWVMPMLQAQDGALGELSDLMNACLLYTSPSPRDA